MTTWAPKRFWTDATVETADAGGWTVALDGRFVRTPARRPLIVPSRALAEAIAAEWQAQEGEVQPMSMPMTRSANAALDKVSGQRDEVVTYIAEYGATDLICYRADGPAALVERQAAAWDPLIGWARSALSAPLIATSGLMAVDQPDGTLATLRHAVEARDVFGLTSLHDLVTLSGSLVIGLAAQAGHDTPARLWEQSRVDEAWQQSQWGEDAEAAETAARKRADFLHAAEFHVLSQAAA
ncbi:MAG: ATP12 family protein [Pseudomonadota bacterium]